MLFQIETIDSMYWYDTKNATTPLAAEKQLIKNIPTELVHKAHHWLILHGRYICLARNPKCQECGLKDICLYYKKEVAPVKSAAVRKVGVSSV